MAQKNGIRLAAEEIEKALYAFLRDRASDKVVVFDTHPGHLRALLGSDVFKELSLGERQRRIWDYLRENVTEDSLKYLYAVHPMDLEEYDRRTHDVNPESSFPQ